MSKKKRIIIENHKKRISINFENLDGMEALGLLRMAYRIKEVEAINNAFLA